MIDHFLDRSATVRSCEKTWLDVAIVVIPTAVITVLNSSDMLLRWVDQTPAAAALLHLLLPLFGTAAVLFVVCARERMVAPAGFHQRSSSGSVYRFCNATRQTAKLSLLPLLGITAVSVTTMAPNGLRGATVASGYVCTARGFAANGSLVQFLDQYDLSVSPPVKLDDRGFFYIHLNRWRSRPLKIVVLAGACAGQKMTRTASQEATSCLAERVESPQTEKAPLWILDCP